VATRAARESEHALAEMVGELYDGERRARGHHTAQRYRAPRSRAHPVPAVCQHCLVLYVERLAGDLSRKIERDARQEIFIYRFTPLDYANFPSDLPWMVTRSSPVEVS
jgi:hypothetical protein